MLSSIRSAFGRQQVQHYGNHLKDLPTCDSALELGEEDEFGFTIIESTNQIVYKKDQIEEKVETLAYCSSSAEATVDTHDVRMTLHLPYPESRSERCDTAARQTCRFESRDASEFMKVSDIPVWLADHLNLATEAKQVTSYFATVDALLQLDISHFTYDFTLERQFLASVE